MKNVNFAKYEIVDFAKRCGVNIETKDVSTSKTKLGKNKYELTLEDNLKMILVLDKKLGASGMIVKNKEELLAISSGHSSLIGIIQKLKKYL